MESTLCLRMRKKLINQIFFGEFPSNEHSEPDRMIEKSS